MTATATILGGVGGIGASNPAHAVPFELGPSADPANGFASAALDALSSDDRVGYAEQLHLLAEQLAPRLGLPAERFVTTWLDADDTSMVAMLSALTQLGVKWRYASSQPGAAFDCSGLVRWAWSQAGVTLPSNSSAIINGLPNTATDELEPGDVMWYPGHVMISLGVDQTYVNAVNRGKPLTVQTLSARSAKRLRAADPVG